MPRLPLLTWLLLLPLLLAACLPAASASQPRPAAPSFPPPAPSATFPLPTPTPQLSTPSPTPSPLPTATATATAFTVCSPLAFTERADLPAILSDPYHPPPTGHDERHHGVDFCYYHHHDRLSILGEPVQAVLAGKVAAALTDSYPYGNVVIIETAGEALPASLQTQLSYARGESLYLLYAHLQVAPEVTLGEQVTACQPIGQVGKSGNAGQAHLHLETRWGPAGAVFPAMGCYLKTSTQTERDAYHLWRTSGTFRHFDPMRLLSSPPPFSP